MNNPLSLTDPSGFSWWTRWRRPLLAIAVAWAIGPAGFWQGGITGNAFASTMVAGFASGGIMGGNIESALQGAFTAAMFYGVGQISGMHDPSVLEKGFLSNAHIAQTFGHAVVGCVSASIAGGSCGAGAASAGFAAAAGPLLPGADISPERFVSRMIVGGIGSRLAGGSFANGATSAAFAYLFNECGHGGCFKDRTHNFDYTQKLCNAGDSWCTADRAMDAHKRYGFPGQREDQVIDSSAQRFTVRGGPVVVGPITSQSPDGGITVFNQTQPGHWFHNGSVTRSLVFREDGIYMRTVGAGVNVNGFWARANTGLSNPGFYTLNDDLRNYMRHQFYRDRAGR
jgi:hypothetical protein